MRAPTVSVIMPCFERLRFVRPAVESVRAQTFPDWELIIADDGSGTAVHAYLQELAREERIRVLHLAHSGNPAAVRNAALHQATAEYVAFIDSDDVWLPRKLELQISSLRARADCGWGYTAYDYIDAAGQTFDLPGLGKWTAHEGQALEAAVRFGLMSALPSVISKRSLLEQVGGFDEKQRFYEDHDLWFRLASRSNADVVPEILLHIRKHHEHYSATDSVRAAECKAELLRRMSVSIADPSLRRTVRYQRALCAGSLARSYLGARSGRSRAVLTLARSFSYSWPYARWWIKAARVLGASTMPSLGTMQGSLRKRSEP